MNLRNLIPWNSKKKSTEVSHPYRDPFYELHRDMNQLFQSFFQDWNISDPYSETSMGRFAPRINVSETDKEIRIEAELPGIDEKEIDVQLKDDVLIIKGEKKSEQKEERENYYVMESSYGSFYRSIQLPDEIDKNKIDAHFKNGIMKITIPKLETASNSQKKIPIRTN
ncbi:MAG: Hsp20/alpha crystallin family protein [Leptospiraceae bacterium]|nr:Hsp20/alpha crystallin family protein [Leptospiraceae bacterium]MCP5512684.1 Hsp20/alpha crystallin family protein [Leptospiraceae bacterium]